MSWRQACLQSSNKTTQGSVAYRGSLTQTVRVSCLMCCKINSHGHQGRVILSDTQNLPIFHYSNCASVEEVGEFTK